MPKSSPVDDLYARLKILRASDLASIAAKELVRRGIESKARIVAAKAAELAREGGMKELTDALTGAMARFFDKPKTSDKGCLAKTAIASALYEFGADAAREMFLRGVRHVQMEPSFGRSIDTAAELRGACALGLVRIGYRDVMIELVDLLADNEPQTRIAAARAIAYAGRDEGALLLRLKIHHGDREPEVIGECLAALVRLAPAKSVEFVARFLHAADPNVAEAAALALGESRQRPALEALRQRASRTLDPRMRRAMFLGIAMLRLPESFEHLLSLIGSAEVGAVNDVIDALAIYRHDDPARARIASAVDARDSQALRQHFSVAMDSSRRD
jgi:hypothetical protein